MNRNAPDQVSEPTGQHEAQGRQQATGCLFRVYWMLAGNLLIALFAFTITQRGGALSAVDVVYWLGGASVIAARYVDIRFLAGATADNQPATLRHWQRHAVAVLGAAGGLWLIAHGASYLFH
jgi:hypothetical protein